MITVYYIYSSSISISHEHSKQYYLKNNLKRKKKLILNFFRATHISVHPFN